MTVFRLCGTLFLNADVRLLVLCLNETRQAEQQEEEQSFLSISDPTLNLCDIHANILQSVSRLFYNSEQVISSIFFFFLHHIVRFCSKKVGSSNKSWWEPSDIDIVLQNTLLNCRRSLFLLKLCRCRVTVAQPFISSHRAWLLELLSELWSYYSKFSAALFV